MEAQAIRKRFLKQMPIWRESEKLHVETELLRHEVENQMQRLRLTTEELDELPRLSKDGKPVVHPARKETDKDIVKLYSKNEAGDITVITENQQTVQEQTTELNSTIELLKKKPQANELVFAMVQEGEPWIECKVKCVYTRAVNSRPVTTFKLITLDSSRHISVGKYAVARNQKHNDKLRVPKRVIAGPSVTQMKAGILGQEPCQQNKNRYMVLMDEGYTEYFKPDQVYPILYQSTQPWKDLHQLGMRNEYFDAELAYFFRQYPRRTLLEANVGQRIEVQRNGVIVPAVILKKDCDTLKIVYKDQSEESIFRGSPRFMKRSDIVSRLLKDDIAIDKLFPKLLGNMKRYSDAGSSAICEDYLKFVENFQTKLNVCGQGTARKSTSRVAPPRQKVTIDEQAVADDRSTQPDLQGLMRSQIASHKCTLNCRHQPHIKTEEDVDDIVSDFRDVCDLKVPLLLGWKRTLVKSVTRNGRSKTVTYIYEAPCGRIFSRIFDIRRYLQVTRSKLDVDYFSFDREVNLNRSLGDRYAYYHESNVALNRSTGQPLEKKNISLINPFNEERLPIDFEYRNETFPHPMLRAKGFSFNHEFKSGCDCEEDCYSRAACACHCLNEQAADTNAHNRGTIDAKCQYKEKRLLQQVSTGIFECNSFCKCSSKCPNRVVQNGIRIRLQIRKTVDKGWGVFVLDDVPKGAFICTYSAELLDDADQYGDSDMYYADLDYITVVEDQKLALDDEGDKVDEGVDFEDEDDDFDAANGNRTKSKKRPMINETDDSQDSVSSSPEYGGNLDKYMPSAKRYPRRNKSNGEGPNRRNVRADNFKRIHTILNESQDYTLDARMQGNIGRFFNHSCDPNAFVQNVFIETHDLRFPVVAFFTKRPLKADDEITWHYNYKVDSIAGRQIPCNCGASNCAGRIL